MESRVEHSEVIVVLIGEHDQMAVREYLRRKPGEDAMGRRVVATHLDNPARALRIPERASTCSHQRSAYAASRIGIVGSGLTEHPAEVYEVLLRGGPLGPRAALPLVQARSLMESPWVR